MKKVLTVLALMVSILLLPTAVSADVSRVSALGTKATISEGYYYLVPRCSTSKTLSIQNNSKSLYATTVSSTNNKVKAQRFYIKAGRGNTYTIRNASSGYFLSVKDASRQSGAIVRQNTWQAVNSQRWYITKAGSYYRIQSSISTKCLSVVNDSTSNGAAVRTATRSTAHSGQYWKLVKVVSSSASSDSTGNYKTSSKTGMSDKDYAVLLNIIGAVETGGQIYGNRDYGDYTAPYTNSSLEYTCTLGWGAFYGDEAQYLISQIQKRDPAGFKKIDSKGLIAAALKRNWVASRWKPSSAEVSVLKKLIVTPVGKKVQDEMVTALMKTYATSCRNLYTNNTWAIMMYSEIRHLGGSNGAKRIFDRCKAKGSYSLNTIMNALKQDQSDKSSSYQVGDAVFWSRHVKCTEFIQKYA